MKSPAWPPVQRSRTKSDVCAEHQPLNLTSADALLVQLQEMAESNHGKAKTKHKSRDKGEEKGKPRSEPYGKGVMAKALRRLLPQASVLNQQLRIKHDL